MSATVSLLTAPLPTPGSVDADALLALEAATQDRPLALDGVIAEATGTVDGVVLIAREGDERSEAERGGIVGMASARLLVDEAHVIRLAVSETARRRGIGRALLDGLVDWARAREASGLLLEVRARNAAAQALYVAAGFVADGRRPGYYPDGEDALLWRLAFAGAGRG